MADPTAAFEAAGGTVLTGMRVDRILLEGSRVVGVRVASGEELRATKVAPIWIASVTRSIASSKFFTPRLLTAP
mgnify:CR=1 FL=1